MSHIRWHFPVGTSASTDVQQPPYVFMVFFVILEASCSGMHYLLLNNCTRWRPPNPFESFQTVTMFNTVKKSHQGCRGSVSILQLRAAFRHTVTGRFPLGYRLSVGGFVCKRWLARDIQCFRLQRFAPTGSPRGIRGREEEARMLRRCLQGETGVGILVCFFYHDEWFQ